MKRVRSGAFIVEVLFAVGLCTAAITAIVSTCGNGFRGTLQAVDNADATSSAMIAIEALRADAGRAVFQGTGDLAITNKGRTLRVLVPGPAEDGKPWEFPGKVVTWRLAPVRGVSGLFQLVRTSSGVSETLRGCWLKDVVVRLRDERTLAAGAFLDIAVTAVGGPASPTAVRLSFLVPLPQLVQARRNA